jgi:serine/threonine protein kinase
MTNDTVVIHKYEIIENIGAGGFSTVYKARHINNDKLVAMKIIKLPMYAKTIMNESKILSYINRELKSKYAGSFPTLHWYGKFGKMVCLATTYYSKSFKEIMYLPDINKPGIFSQMIGLMRCIHDLYIIHCDVKPDNFMINDSNNLTLIDFGLARPYFDVNTRKHVPNCRRERVEKTQYMSEYVQQGDRPARRDDMISIGKIMVEMDFHNNNYEKEVKDLKYEDQPNYDKLIEFMYDNSV